MRCLIIFFALMAVASAQFGNLFEQMFGGHDHDGGHQHQQGGRNNPSDASVYRQRYEQCTYPFSPTWLCPGVG